MPRYETRSSQFGLVSGIRQQASDMVLAAESAGLFDPTARKGRLYIVAETDQDVARGRDACQLICRSIRKQFYGDTSFSVTASLRKAIVAANRLLYQQNFGAPVQKRAFVGVTCAVVKGDDVYLAQVKPAQTYLMAEGKLRALPAGHSWRQSQERATTYFKPNALGNSLTIEPEFFRAVLRPGDGLLLCTSNLAPLLDREQVMRLLRAAEPEDMADGLVGLCQEHGITEAHGLALGVYAVLSPAARSAPLSRAGVSERAWLTVRGAGDGLARLASEAALLAKWPPARGERRRASVARDHDRREAERLQEPYEAPEFSPDPPPLPKPLELGPTIDERAAEERANRRWRLDTLQSRPPELRRLTPSALLGESSYAPPPPIEPSLELHDTPGMAALGRDARPARATLPPEENPFGPRRGPLRRLASSLGNARRRKRPPPQAIARPRRQPGLSYRRQRPPFPWLLLLLLVSLVTLLVLYGTNLTRENAVREADTTLQLAEQAVSAIREAPDEAAASERLAAAREALADVQASGMVTATVDSRRRFDELEREYERALAAIQKLTYFENLEQVAEHPVPGGLFDSVVVPPPPRGITNTVGFASLYLLDTNAGVLFRAPREGGRPEPMLRPEDVVDLLPVGRVRAQAWRFDNIVAVAQSSEGGSFNYYFRSGNSWRFSILAGSETWGRITDQPFRVANYEGNLYVWGVVSGNILRYLSGQFGEFPLPWIENDGRQQFESAVDLAVDGKLYLLQPTGAVMVFSTNEATLERAFEREIPAPQVDPPLTVATRFAVTGETPESGFIFLLDATNERVIQLDKVTGELIQQIRARPEAPFDLNQLFAIAVDDSLARPAIYLVNGGQLLRGSLPDRPRPFREAGTPGPASPTLEPTAAP
jgi:serine/threonine protein phosphatase PrpC